jgi:D-sedoheptulose 7-phosphate isomerase
VTGRKKPSDEDNSEQAIERIAGIVHESLDAKVLFFADQDQIRLVERAARQMIDALKAGGKILLFGNGGSACDAQHIAGELANVFLNRNRKALPAFALTTDGALMTSIANDTSFVHIFDRQIQALGRRGDVAVGISTSGNSPNVVKGLEAARYQNMHTIGLLGRDGGRAASIVDIALVVRHTETARIQEVHTLIGHILCHLIEAEVFGDTGADTATADTRAGGRPAAAAGPIKGER